jgi:hypothetical protein
MGLEIIQSTLSEASINDLPPIAFSLDSTGSSLIAKKFPAPRCYIELTSPPERAVVFAVRSYRSEVHNYEVLENQIGRIFYSAKFVPIHFKENLTTYISNIERIAQVFTTGRAASRKKWCAVLVPSPDGEPYGLVLVFGVYIGLRGDMERTDVLQHPAYERLLESFSLNNSV